MTDYTESRKYICKARLDLEKGNYNKALNHINYAIMEEGENSDAYGLKAIILSVIGKQNESNNALMYFHKLGDENNKIDYLTDKIEVINNQNDIFGAIKSSEDLYETYSTDWEKWNCNSNIFNIIGCGF